MPEQADLRRGIANAILPLLPPDLHGSAARSVAYRYADAALAVVEGEALDRMAEHFINETKIRSMDFRHGMSMDLEPARELAAIWVGCARGMLGDAPNYTETPVTFTVKLAGEVEQYAFTLQRVGKMTPHQARQAAEERAEKAEAIVARVGELADLLTGIGEGLTGAYGEYAAHSVVAFEKSLRRALAALDDTADADRG